MPARWLQTKRFKMKKARAKRPRFVSYDRLDEEIGLESKHEGMCNYRGRGKLTHEGDKLDMVFFKQDRHMMSIEHINENGKLARKLISKEGFLGGARTVSEERNASLMARASQAIEFDNTPVRGWFNVFNSYTVLKDSEKGTWTKVFFDRSQYVFVERMQNNRVRRSIKYSSKQAAERMLRANRVSWYPSEEIPELPS